MAHLYLFLVVGSATDSIAKAPVESSRDVDILAIDCSSLIEGKTISSKNPIACDRLKTVSFTYLGYDHQEYKGQMVVLDIVAPHLRNLMNDLLRQKFPIFQAQPIRVYQGDDHASMNDNNSSAFNGRAIKNSSRWSMHAYGAAVDINPVENPYIEIKESGKIVVNPAKGARYSVNRLAYRPNKAARKGLVEGVVDIFAHHGFFVWGGDWNHPIDYQHFQFGTRSYIEKITALSHEKSVDEIQKNINLYRQCRANQQNNKLKARKLCVEEVLHQLEKL